MRVGSWKTTDISIGDRNPTSINFANNDNQIVFNNKIKYFQQSLGFLAKTMTEEEKEAVKTECKKFILNDQKPAKNFNECTEEDQESVLTYSSSGKVVIPYEMITSFGSLDISPEENQFFLPHQFYSCQKEMIITNEDYEAVKKFYQTIKLRSHSELNKLYNFQDTIILCAIF